MHTVSPGRAPRAAPRLLSLVAEQPRHRHVRAGLVLVCALAALGPVAGDAAVARAQMPFRGLNTHSARDGTSDADMLRELDAVQRSAANTVRMDLGWASLEEAGKGQWSAPLTARVDRVLDAASQRGIGVILTFLSTPCWASSAPDSVKQNCAPGWWSRGVARYPPANPSDYADAVEFVVRRWGSQLAALEVWNEPNLDTFWTTPDPAGDYVRLLTAAYERAKLINTGVRIVGGAISGSDGTFLRSLYAAGFKGRHDGISFHPYTNHQPDQVVAGEDLKDSYVQGVPWMQGIATAHGEGSIGLWLTETGFSSCTERAICVSETDQAQYTNELFRIADRWSYVRALLVYELRNDGTNSADKEHNFGLLRQDFSAKPAYGTFTDAMHGLYVP